MDAAMASLLILLTAVDEGLGACFFGIQPEYEAATREAFGIPDDVDPVGAITLGHRPPDEAPSGSPTSRKRRPLAEVVHRGSWGG
jgi:nitroreductase